MDAALIARAKALEAPLWATQLSDVQNVNKSNRDEMKPVGLHASLFFMPPSRA